MALRILRASTSNVIRQARRQLSSSAVRRQEVIPNEVPPGLAADSAAADDGPPIAPSESHPKKDLRAIPKNPLSSHLTMLQYHMHIGCTSNNTHITLTNELGRPVKNGIWTGGSLGFKGVNRSGYEAGYQCAVRAFDRIQELSKEVPGARFELLFKGFGQGRDAVYKALMTSEGEFVRPYVNRVTDTTPIKIGGTRAKKMRRL